MFAIEADIRSLMRARRLKSRRAFFSWSRSRLTADGPCMPALDTTTFQDAQQRIEEISQKPIFFIVGCQKSGTTWLQHLLGAHDEICCNGEGRFAPLLRPAIAQLAKGYNQVANRDHHSRASDLERGVELSPDDVDYLCFAAMTLVMAGWPEARDASVIGEKTPEHAVSLNLLERFFPQCRAIHIIRDVRDVCVSGWFHNLRRHGADFRKQFPAFADYAAFMAGRHWGLYIRKARAWGAANPDRYLEVRYEDLHADPQSVTRTMLEFLDVDADDDAAAQCVDAASFENLSGGRSNGEEDRSSFFRSGTVGDWREHFDDQALQAVVQQVGPVMADLGYDD